jgi:hypothetical protein
MKQKKTKMANRGKKKRIKNKNENEKNDTRRRQQIVRSVTRPEKRSEKRIAKNFDTRLQPDIMGQFEVEKDNNPPFFVFRGSFKGFSAQVSLSS